ncbi:hypothetical protein Bpfe_012543 [Biomphalaria pfeifferi]|uniref:Uncharacterized protein n=1 Tax=Biomphalaria pfeifferi TaxID=112525 RepID=A0AAD8FB45_BIOPF|nr:hypothetical protein Bpfe_012543 [Biomphalaria pfeifferi]
MPHSGSQRKPTSGVSRTLHSRSAAPSTTGLESTSEDDKTTVQHFELLHYDWPDLPPIAAMKDAVCRKGISRGISYLLPVDKGSNSINCKYRTDLRAMFQEPYVQDDHQYNDSLISIRSKVHFLTNQGQTRWTPQLTRSVPIKLNTASESVRKTYSRSAPVNGKRSGLGYGLAPRGVYGLPLRTHARKSELDPDLAKLKKEADDIISQTLMESDTGPVIEKGQEVPSDKTFAFQTDSCGSNCPVQTHLFPRVHGNTGNMPVSTLDISQIDDADLSTKQKYEEFRSQLSRRCRVNRVPERYVSPFLHQDRNQDIWTWLHHGETISEFDYFMSKCG